MLHFDPETGLYGDDTAVIRDDVAQSWAVAIGADPMSGNVLDTSPGTPAGQLVDSQAALVASKDREVLYMASQFNPAVNEGVWQDALGQLYFLPRKGPAPTLVDVMCYGLPGTTISGMVRATTGNLLTAQVPTVIPPSGAVLVQFATNDNGPIVIPAGTVTEIVTSVPGWDSVNNPIAGVQGRNKENRREYEARRVASVAKNSQGRAVSIWANITEINDVIDSVVFENDRTTSQVKFGVTIPPHSFYICVAGGLPSEIAKAIYERKDGGAATFGARTATYTDPAYPWGPYTYKYDIPSVLGITVTVNIRSTPSTPSDIDVRIKKAVDDAFYGRGNTERVKMATTLFASLFYTPVIVAGVDSLVSITINKGAGEVDSIDINANQLPSLSNTIVNVVT